MLVLGLLSVVLACASCVYIITVIRETVHMKLRNDIRLFAAVLFDSHVSHQRHQTYIAEVDRLSFENICQSTNCSQLIIDSFI